MPEQRLRHIRDITMTAVEREVLRHKLYAYAVANPVPRSLSMRTWYWALQHGAVALGLAFLCVVGGTSVSAERSRPGDFLYGFRLSVNDRIETALAFNDDAQIDVEMEQLQRVIDDEDVIRDNVLTELAFQVVQDADENLEVDFERELREIERELNEQAREQDAFHAGEDESDDSEYRSPVRTPELFDDEEFDDELRSIERELREEERARLELE